MEISWIGEVPIEERFALLMQANFSGLGIKAAIRKYPWARFTEQVTKPHISQIFANAVTGDPDTLLCPMYHSSVRGTWQAPEYLDDEQVGAALEKGRTAT